VIRGWLGVTIQPLTPELSKQFGLEDEKGVLVGDVVEDSPAEKAGIQRGDVIVVRWQRSEGRYKPQEYSRAPRPIPAVPESSPRRQAKDGAGENC
jgi:serine protease Do